MASIAFYGPDDRRATKVAVGIQSNEDSETEMSRWQSPDIDARQNAAIMEEIVKLIRRRQVKSLAMPEQILGCPHEEGIDYPSGAVCSNCPFWAGRPRPIIDDADDVSSEPAIRIPDRRGMEKTLASFGPSLHEDTALDRAQGIMWEAWDEQDSARRIQLARKALSISAHCADAFVMLAEESATSLKEATELYEKGVQAGERALGEKTFKEDEGHFWGILETRPYMRARAGLASCLREAGKIEQAIGHYKELLRLNPNDNQGNRHMLAVCLISAGRDAEAAELMEQYPDEISADGTYTEALVAFRVSGASREACAKLRHALKRNPNVPPYLLGRKRMPKRLPQHYALGSVDEAAIYSDLHGENWNKTKGALEWLDLECKKEF